MRILDPVMSCKEASAFEKDFFGGDENAAYSAMKRAGAGAAKMFLEEFSPFLARCGKPRIVCLAGKGNNGGDAIIMASEIGRAFVGAEVFVFMPGGAESMGGLCLRAFREHLAGNENAELSSDFSALESKLKGECIAVIEGLAGMNFRPPLSGGYARCLDMANAADAKVKAAVDLPAGICEALPPDEHAFRADVSYAVGTAKAALFEGQNAEYTGRIRYVDLGFFDSKEPFCGPGRGEFVVREHALDRVFGQLRPSRSDKRNYGHLYIFSGSMSYPGAALLNVKGALKSGVGLVTAFVPEHLAPSFAAAEPSAIWVPCPTDESGALSLESFYLYKGRAGRETAILMGSGATKSAESAALFEQVLKESGSPAVLDADAITAKLFGLLQGRANSLITPHMGEFLRIAADSSDASLLAAAKGAAVLLKGPVTSVCDGERIARCPRGCPVLSRGGSGDILSGLCGGLLARKDLSLAAFDAAALGAQWLGVASERAFARFGQDAVSTREIADIFLREAAGYRG